MSSLFSMVILLFAVQSAYAQLHIQRSPAAPLETPSPSLADIILRSVVLRQESNPQTSVAGAPVFVSNRPPAPTLLSSVVSAPLAPPATTLLFSVVSTPLGPPPPSSITSVLGLPGLISSIGSPAPSSIVSNPGPVNSIASSLPSNPPGSITGVSPGTSPTGSFLTSASTPSSSPSSSPTSTPDPPSDGGLSTGAKAGIGVGSTLGGVFVLVLVFFLGKRSRGRSTGKHDNDQEAGVPGKAELAGNPIAATKTKHELDGGNVSGFGRAERIQELPGDHGHAGAVKYGNTVQTEPAELDSGRYVDRPIR
ncbi:hypothetical protein B0J11DRAFT_582222 [Dendryphion nanum]|uniref:Uncharacterized protein n=1 Tax=Dendryphion nanum TaxID=256645 RepID=A0A9P9DJE0_9PLEO|nr:hypothetical protein B0J11DRAFT_582222 [Dendryphion nanum]